MTENTPRLLKELSYYCTGGSCDLLFEPRNLQELAEARREIHERNVPHFFLGGGTNSLVMDEHFPGAVIAFHKMRKLDFDGTTAHVDAGIENTSFSEEAYQRSLAGAAWMNRLPGQLGGTTRMNARCYGGEISQIVTRVVTVTATGKIREYRDPNVFRGYKNTIFMENDEAIAGVDIALANGDPSEIRKLMDHCAADRISKNQFIAPSCGCAFKNNYEVGVPSGMLLEAAGVHGLSFPGIQINPKHANFVFNRGASSRDILAFTFKMQELVYQKFGAWLAFEMEILGTIPPDLQQRLGEIRPQKLNDAALQTLRERFQKGPR